MSIILPYMVRAGAQQHITEPYVSVPPALTIPTGSPAFSMSSFVSFSSPTAFSQAARFFSSGSSIA